VKALLVNPPYQTLTSNFGVGHQVPLGLLMVGGALRDAGHQVELLDAEALHLSDDRIVQRVRAAGPGLIMTGHAGSTPAHPVCVRLLRAVRRSCPGVTTVYGGVYPTYHAEAILRSEPAVDIVVRGEGEAGAVDLAGVLGEAGRAGLRRVDGISFRDRDTVVRNPDRAPIADLDAFRTGWELIDDWDRYRCFGLGRAAIVQFSRGCPHRCTYCGQHGFWVKWRRRSPASLAEEIAWLRRTHGVRFITLADENPTTSKAQWRRLLEEIIARNLGVHFFATIRASDIVRDADMLHLYRRAGLLYILLGIDATDPDLLEQIRKHSTARVDLEACRLLREHGIRSIIAHIVGLGSETPAEFRRARRALHQYDGDLLNIMYATPHSWTRFGAESGSRPVVQEDQRRWDYRHQVLGQTRMSPRRLFASVKWLELAYHARPRRLARLLLHRDPFVRRQLRWTALHTGAVWLAEIIEFAGFTRFARTPTTLREWLRRSGVVLGTAGPQRTDREPVPLSVRGAALQSAPSACAGRGPVGA
jgi:anaerobic magnesium-protoporphyrin IX monomethyl ester cyclase